MTNTRSKLLLLLLAITTVAFVWLLVSPNSPEEKLTLKGPKPSKLSSKTYHNSIGGGTADEQDTQDSRGGGIVSGSERRNAGVSAGRIDPAKLREFATVEYSEGKPHFEGERVTAYVAVPSSGEKLAMEVNQMGEYPRLHVNPEETAEVRLQFSSVETGSRVAVAAQDGGKLDGQDRSTVLEVDDHRQVAFAFTASENEGIHRVVVTTSAGETKLLDFWVGPDHEIATP